MENEEVMDRVEDDRRQDEDGEDRAEGGTDVIVHSPCINCTP